MDQQTFQSKYQSKLDFEYHSHSKALKHPETFPLTPYEKRCREVIARKDRAHCLMQSFKEAETAL